MADEIIVSYSELDTFRQCPLKHQLAYKQRWTKPKDIDSALGKGTLYHQVMEKHFRIVKAAQDANGKAGNLSSAEVRDTLALAKSECMEFLIDPRTGDPYSDVHDLIKWMYEGYVEYYGINPEWRIMAVEHNIVTPLRSDSGRRSRYKIKAKLDLIVRERATGALWVVDHKSGANLPSNMDLELDDQFGLYTWMMREMGRPIIGSIHMANRTQRNKSFMPLETRMKKTYLNRSDVELDNIAKDAYEVARAAYPPKGERGSRYSSPDPRQCGWKCDFKEPHLLMRQGRDPQEVLTEYGFKIDRTRH